MSTAVVDDDTPPFVPAAVDRSVRPKRTDRRTVQQSVWLTPQEALSLSALQAARATRTGDDSPPDDALADAVKKATGDRPVSGSLALFVRAVCDDAVAASPFPVTRAQAAQSRLLEDALLSRLQTVARHGVLQRSDLAALPLSELDVVRLFSSLRQRTPLPDLASLLTADDGHDGSDLLPLVVRDDDAPPTAAEVQALSAKDPALAQALVALSSIPATLPAVEDALTDVDPRTFEGVEGLFVQHLLGTQVPTLRALMARGLDPARVTLVGVPYSTSAVTAQALRGLGFDVVTPTLSDPRTLEDVNRQALEQALERVLVRARRRRAPVLVLDDGAKAAALLHARAAAGDRDLGDVHMVEQTARGVTVLAQLPRILWPVVDVARSLQKHHEQDSIGGEVVRGVAKALLRVGCRFGSGVRVVVLGVGVIGTGVARAAAARGCDVVVWDKDGGRRARARALGFSCDDDRAASLRGADVIIGCAGATSVWAADLALVNHGCALASASSRNIEIDLSPLSDPRVQSKVLVVEGPGGGRFATVAWRLQDKDVLLLHNGFPINFDGGIETGTADSIAPTRALMARGAVQALRETVPGLHPLRA